MPLKHGVDDDCASQNSRCSTKAKIVVVIRKRRGSQQRDDAKHDSGATVIAKQLKNGIHRQRKERRYAHQIRLGVALPFVDQEADVFFITFATFSMPSASHRSRSNRRAQVNFVMRCASWRSIRHEWRLAALRRRNDGAIRAGRASSEQQSAVIEATFTG